MTPARTIDILRQLRGEGPPGPGRTFLLPVVLTAVAAGLHSIVGTHYDDHYFTIYVAAVALATLCADWRAGLIATGFGIPIAALDSPNAEPLIFLGAVGALASLAIDSLRTAHIQADERARTEVTLSLRSQFLAAASTSLDASLDVGDSLAAAISVAVPALADWCIIDLKQADGSVERFAASGGDVASNRPDLERLRRVLWEQSTQSGPGKVLATGAPDMIYAGGPLLSALLEPGDPRRAAIQRADVSAVAVPLTAHGLTFGAVTLVRCGGDNPFQSGDIPFCCDLALRIALAIDNARLYAAARHEIEERRRTEQQLRENEEQLGLALEAGRLGTWRLNFASGRMSWSEQQVRFLSRLSCPVPPDLAAFLTLVHPEDRDAVWSALTEGASGELGCSLEHRIVTPDGSTRWLLSRGRTIHGDASGDLLGISMDITDRKATEEALAERQRDVETLNHRLRRAMTETHHRVKNNLQIISAMVDMQIEEKGASVSTSDFERLGSQIRALAAVHDVLTHESRGRTKSDRVSVRGALARVLELLQQAMPDRTLESDIADEHLDSKAVSALALLINELVNNSVKHGGRRVSVTLLSGNGRMVLKVEDNGPGFAAGFDPAAASNTGLDLVDNLVRTDLAGSVTYTNGRDGAMVTVDFPFGERNGGPARVDASLAGAEAIPNLPTAGGV